MPVLAENPTPYNEWDFDISKMDVQQNTPNLEKLDISITALFAEIPLPITFIRHIQHVSLMEGANHFDGY